MHCPIQGKSWQLQFSEDLSKDCQVVETVTPVLGALHWAMAVLLPRDWDQKTPALGGRVIGRRSLVLRFGRTVPWRP